MDKDEKQSDLFDYDDEYKFEKFRPLIKLKKTKKHLEKEKKNYLETVYTIVKGIDFDKNQVNGRPRTEIKDVVKSLLIMSFNGMSYRRTESDLEMLKKQKYISKVPKKSTLNKYMNIKDMRKLLEKMIEFISLFFADNEDTLIMDSTWLATKMYSGGYKKVYDKKSAPLDKVRKLHVSCLKNSRIICCARVTEGTKHDSPMFMELLMTPLKNGFNIKTLLADAGYLSDKHYQICKDLNIDGYLDFKSNSKLKRKCSEWRAKLEMYKKNPDMWHSQMRFRVIVEGIFSAIKRKNTNYLRARNIIAQDCELLLKCLSYNITILRRFE